MGTTLQGIVESYVSGIVGRRDSWEAFAQIEFNKDYPLMSALREKATFGWPPDVEISAMSWGVLKDFIDTGLCWATLEQLESLDLEDPSPQFIGTLAFMRAFLRPTRVLFYTE